MVCPFFNCFISIFLRICLPFFQSLFGPYTGSSNLDELNALLSSTIMIRRFKKDVLPQLPKKNRDQVALPSQSLFSNSNWGRPCISSSLYREQYLPSIVYRIVIFLVSLFLCRSSSCSRRRPWRL